MVDRKVDSIVIHIASEVIETQRYEDLENEIAQLLRKFRVEATIINSVTDHKIIVDKKSCL
ncbi:MAG TPA: hypothetical protein VN260_01475 [Dissulfurispiraceae bacterium]|nr:hypothetical protein [Dissulfurispiraceae bacterium]